MILFLHLPGPHNGCLLLMSKLSHHLLKSLLSLQLVLLGQPLILLQLLDLLTELLIIYHAPCISLYCMLTSLIPRLFCVGGKKEPGIHCYRLHLQYVYMQVCVTLQKQS